MRKALEKWQSLPIAVKVSSAYVFCTIVQRCLLFLTTPLFTRLLTTEQYGQIVVYTSWQSVLQIFLTLNLAYGSFSNAMLKFEDNRDGYIASVQGICLVLTGLFLLVYLPFAGLWNQLFEMPTWAMILMAVEMIFMTALQLWSGKKRFEFRYKSIVLVTLLMAVLTPVLQYLLVIHSEEKGYARIIGMAAVNIIGGGIFFFMNLIRGRKLFRRKYWDYALRFNIPLLIYYLSQVVFNQSDRIMISHMVGIDKAAVYGVAYGLATILIFVLDAINNAYVPWLYARIRTGTEAENRSVSLGIAALMAILLAGVSWFAPEIIGIMAGEKYMEAVYVVPPVTVSLLLLFYCQLFGNYEFYYEEKKSLIWATIGAAAANFLLNWIFIGIYGYIAAAYTTLFSYIILTACHGLAMKLIMKKHQRKGPGYNYRGLLLLFFGYCGVAAAGALLYGTLLVRAAVAFLVLLILFTRRKMILNLIRTIRQKDQTAGEAAAAD